jgi:hypothetical protein
MIDLGEEAGDRMLRDGGRAAAWAARRLMSTLKVLRGARAALREQRDALDGLRDEGGTGVGTFDFSATYPDAAKAAEVARAVRENLEGQGFEVGGGYAGLTYITFEMRRRDEALRTIDECIERMDEAIDGVVDEVVEEAVAQDGPRRTPAPAQGREAPGDPGAGGHVMPGPRKEHSAPRPPSGHVSVRYGSPEAAAAAAGVLAAAGIAHMRIEGCDVLTVRAEDAEAASTLLGKTRWESNPGCGSKAAGMPAPHNPGIDKTLERAGEGIGKAAAGKVGGRAGAEGLAGSVIERIRG